MSKSLSADVSFQFLDLDLALGHVGDAAVLQQMLEMLRTKLAGDIPLIHQYLAEQQLIEANRLLHPLKGIVPIFCAGALCAEVAAVEILSKTGPIEEVQPLYAQLRPKLERLQWEVDAHLSSSAMVNR